MRVRQSFLRTFMDCPLQARFQSIDLLPRQQNAKASFGTVIHFVLEQYNKNGNLEQAIDLFKEYWKSPEKLGVAPEIWPKFATYGGLRQRGIEILQQYHSKVKWETRKVIATEHRFLVPFGEHEIEGTIDLLEFKKDRNGKVQLHVVDYKTNTRAPTVTELLLNIQFTVYVYASLQPEFWFGNGPDFPPINGADDWYPLLENAPRKAIWYHLWTNKAIDAGARDDPDFMRLYRCITEIDKAIKAGIFVPDISGENCIYCPYHAPCGIPYKEELHEDKEDRFQGVR